MKILHTADWHSNSNFESFIESTEFIKNYIIKNNIDLMVYSGDLFDSKIIASDLYNKIINRFKEFADLCPIFMVYGTPSHDYRGSLDILREVNTKYPMHIVDSMKKSMKYFSPYYSDIDYFSDAPLDNSFILLIGLPWPMKYRFLTDAELLNLNLSEQNELQKKRFNIWRKKVLDERKKHIVKSILVAHLQLEGTVPSFNQDISSDNHLPTDYYDLCDYGALGHIHKAQSFKNLHYAGSIYNKTWGEMDKKYFNVIDTDDMSKEKICIPTPLLIKIVCDLKEYQNIKKHIEKNDELIFDGMTISIDEKINLWLVVNIENKKVMNFVEEEAFFLDKFNVIRLEFAKIKTNALQRVENYNRVTSLEEKFKLWCKQKLIEPSEFQINKIKELE